MGRKARTAGATTLIALAACSGGIRATRPGAAPGAARAVAEARAELRRAVDSMIAAPQFRNAHWGVLIVDPEAGDTLYSHNAGKLFLPASNQKILTGAVALAQLGPDFRFRTTFAVRRSPSAPAPTVGPLEGAVFGGGARGAIPRRPSEASPPAGSALVVDGVLQGDLVVIGRGDPTVSDHMFGDAMVPLRAAAESLAAHGVTRVAGRLLRGGDAFSDANYGFGWAWDDFDYAYSAGVDELLFNEGFSRVTVRGGARAGDPPVVRVAPSWIYPDVRVTAATVAPSGPPSLGDVGTADTARRAGTEITVARDSGSAAVLVAGTVVAGDSETVSVPHREPARAYLLALSQALAERGITVSGGVSAALADAAPAAGAGAVTDTLFTLVSPPLAQILPALEKPSQNQIAEVLLKTLGLEKTGVGTADSGRAVVERQLVAWGADPEGFAVRDGSGLSRHDYVSPETIVRVLDAMRRDPNFRLFYDALPVAGVDGTIASRMRGTPAQGNVHAKTGYVDRARSLSGYVTSADGELLVFSLLCNNWTTPVRLVERVQDEIAARLAALPVRAR